MHVACTLGSIAPLRVLARVAGPSYLRACNTRGLNPIEVRAGGRAHTHIHARLTDSARLSIPVGGPGVRRGSGWVCAGCASRIRPGLPTGLSGWVGGWGWGDPRPPTHPCASGIRLGASASWAGENDRTDAPAHETASSLSAAPAPGRLPGGEQPRRIRHRTGHLSIAGSAPR